VTSHLKTVGLDELCEVRPHIVRLKVHVICTECENNLKAEKKKVTKKDYKEQAKLGLVYSMIIKGTLEVEEYEWAELNDTKSLQEKQAFWTFTEDTRMHNHNLGCLMTKVSRHTSNYVIQWLKHNDTRRIADIYNTWNELHPRNRFANKVVTSRYKTSSKKKRTIIHSIPSSEKVLLTSQAEKKEVIVTINGSPKLKLKHNIPDKSEISLTSLILLSLSSYRK
jgi:hypothetical protein